MRGVLDRRELQTECRSRFVEHHDLPPGDQLLVGIDIDGISDRAVERDNFARLNSGQFSDRQSDRSKNKPQLNRNAPQRAAARRR
jgi:hypothetical protein